MSSKSEAYIQNDYHLFKKIRESRDEAVMAVETHDRFTYEFQLI